MKKGMAFTKRLRCSCGTVVIVPKNRTGKVKCPGCNTISKANAIVESEKKGKK